MSNEETIEKAVRKALANGWQHEGWKMIFTVPALKYTTEDWTELLDEQRYWFIWNHDFARALWGEEHHVERFEVGEVHLTTPNWQYHLQEMVISPDPIAYLAEHMEDK